LHQYEEGQARICAQSAEVPVPDSSYNGPKPTASDPQIPAQHYKATREALLGWSRRKIQCNGCTNVAAPFLETLALVIFVRYEAEFQGVGHRVFDGLRSLPTQGAKVLYFPAHIVALTSQLREPDR
jgi:hypothetical protein